MVGIGVHVFESINRVNDLVRAANRAQGYIPTGDALGHGHDIWLNAKMLDPKPATGSPEATDHLIDNEQYPIIVADLPDNFPVSGRRGQSAEPLLDRLTDEGGNLLRSLKFNNTSNIPGADQVAVGIAQMERTAIAVRGFHKDRSRGQRLHGVPHGQNRTQGPKGQRGDTMVGPPP